ncbi:von Hippel-Lindau disease tumor suppressor-like [Planococcus citri]|uniref:von Hippel-Lindau disease tumor suppressor-like n=1 Tax=Planococcus citri TaxID=170843 RepID=UPI0031F8F660
MSIFKSISSIQAMKLRSQTSDPISIRFFNLSLVNADLLWIDYEGNFKQYLSLKPKQFVDVNTYSGHYWIIREKNTDKTLLLNNKEYFCADEQKLKDYRMGMRRNSSNPSRYCVAISKPIPALKTIVISYLSNYIRNCENVKHLEIPKTLKKEIIDKIHHDNRSIHEHLEDKDMCLKNLNPEVPSS